MRHRPWKGGGNQSVLSTTAALKVSGGYICSSRLVNTTFFLRHINFGAIFQQRETNGTVMANHNTAVSSNFPFVNSP